MKVHAATIAIAGLIAGCSGAAAPQTTGPEVKDPPRSVEENLASLKGLQIFEVAGIVQHIPESANCYNLPCPGHEAEFEAAKAADTQHLDTFTKTALAAAADPASTDPADLSAATTNLDKLRQLDVVQIGELVLAVPENNPNCYNLPCESDKQAAEATNNERAGQLANIAKAF
jgi:hypothetical protein